MVKVNETEYGETETLEEFSSYKDAKAYFDERVIAFLDGNDDEMPDITDDKSNFFRAEYEDGEVYSLEIITEE